MNLLITTQKVDAAGDVLGFFYSWIQEFSRHFETVTVICLEKGEGVASLPSNVTVFSLGKEKIGRTTPLHRIRYAVRFLRYIVRNKNSYDAVFVHMNPEYVVLGGLLWRAWGKRIGLWYVHRQTDLKLWLAEKFTHIIWSTTPEAFRLKSDKVLFVGHGINFFQFPRRTEPPPSKSFRILHVGRITPIKNLYILIEAARLLKKRGRDFSVCLLGEAATPVDLKYEKELNVLVEKYGLKDDVQFLGKVVFPNTGRDYQKSDISVNLTPTGGMDKAVLESIASGTIALSANKAFRELFGTHADSLLYNERDPEDTANKIEAIMDMEPLERRGIEDYLYARAREQFDLNALIHRIVQDLKHV